MYIFCRECGHPTDPASRKPPYLEERYSTYWVDTSPPPPLPQFKRLCAQEARSPWPSRCFPRWLSLCAGRWIKCTQVTCKASDISLVMGFFTHALEMHWAKAVRPSCRTIELDCYPGENKWIRATARKSYKTSCLFRIALIDVSLTYNHIVNLQPMVNDHCCRFRWLTRLGLPYVCDVCWLVLLFVCFLTLHHTLPPHRHIPSSLPLPVPRLVWILGQCACNSKGVVWNT